MRNIAEGRLTFTANLGECVRFGEAIFICVGTPPLPNGEADLSAVDSVARLIALESCSPKLVVEKSTVPMRTGESLLRALTTYGRKSGQRFSVASNPEFLREGTAIRDFLHPDRIVLGVSDSTTEKQLREIYRPIADRDFVCPIHDSDCSSLPAPPLFVTSVNSAELIKHACNSFLALKISYANLLADICEGLHADVKEVVQAMSLDPRIGGHFLEAGLGFGGFCLPKDLQAFIRVGENASVDMSLLREVDAVNRKRVDRLVRRVRRAVWVLKGKCVGVLGLAFKPGTDDIRFAPALELVQRLLDEQVEVQVHDPQGMEKTKPLFPEVRFCETPQQVAEEADALIVATEWKQFKMLDWELMRDLMARPLIFDGRNVLNRSEMEALGFEYHGTGRGARATVTTMPPAPVESVSHHVCGGNGRSVETRIALTKTVAERSPAAELRASRRERA